MASSRTLWQRMGQMFRRHDGQAPEEPGGGTWPQPGQGERAALDSARPEAIVERTERARQHALDQLRVSSGRSLWPWGARRAAPSQAMAMRLANLADAMQEHFHRQDERTERVAQTLARVGGVLEQLAEAQRAESEVLQAIAQQNEANGRNAAILVDTISRVPDALLSQAESICAVARQLESVQESDVALTESLGQFGRAVDTLGASGTVQVQTLQRLSEAQQQQHETLTALVRQQSRRFLVLLLVTLVLAVAVGAGAAALLLVSAA